MGKYTGVEHKPERLLQPYSVWLDGSIIRFAKSKKEADEVLEKAIDREKRYTELRKGEMPIQVFLDEEHKEGKGDSL